MSMTPAFSPGPWITHGALVGNPRRCSLEDLYEQCSFHIAEKIPSSVKLGTRPINLRMRSYSSGLRPVLRTSSGGFWRGGGGPPPPQPVVPPSPPLPHKGGESRSRRADRWLPNIKKFTSALPFCF